ncbi:NYN domain limkain-b1-type [Arabidopsis thaliana x Arabidopsis arenosa]|uniref:NYN domain limkain-b1-type n=1 Tax=Arabidopsis thaliana x Arabidopsis arenosa TaxID=1240361 RepID=A0A8T1ZU75_9BRAS|nr:NYN domain limkain-b1-type [Arabidopsis thaliana x Arabidopsis arenosa]
MFLSQCRSCKPLLESRLPLLRLSLSKCLDQSFKTTASSEYGSKIPDALLGHRGLEDHKASVFWDMEDYKIPDGLSAGEVSKNIKTAFSEMGYPGTVSIKAYADATNRRIQDNEFHSAGIELKRVPEGSKGMDHSRDIAVLTGMAVWIAANREVSSSMMVISDSIYDFAVDQFKKINHYVLWKKLSAKGKPIAQTRRYSKR